MNTSRYIFIALLLVLVSSLPLAAQINDTYVIPAVGQRRRELRDALADAIQRLQSAARLPAHGQRHVSADRRRRRDRENRSPFRRMGPCCRTTSSTICSASRADRARCSWRRSPRTIRRCRMTCCRGRS